MIKILYLNLQKSYDFQTVCSISIHRRRHRSLFSFNPDIRLLPSNIGTVKEIKTAVENSELVPSKKKKYCVSFNDSWCNKL